MKQEITKTQAIRVIDFTLLGPFMIYLGLKKEKLSDTEKALILISGIATILYNYNNWRKNL